MKRLFLCSAVLACMVGPAEEGRAAPLLRDAYVAVVSVSGTYLSDFALTDAGLEFVKFGTPPLALASLDLPTSVADLSGFTETDPMDHRTAFLAFENLSTGGLFTTYAPLSALTFTRVPQLGPPLFRVDFEATMASLFGGLPVTTVSGWYSFEVVAPILVDPALASAQYAVVQSFITAGGTPFASSDGRIYVQDMPEPSLAALLVGGCVLVAFRRRRFYATFATEAPRRSR